MTCLIDPEPTSDELSLYHRIYSKAAQLLTRDGGLQPVAFFRVGNKPILHGPTKGMIIPLKMDMPRSDAGKDAVAEALRHVRKDLDADLVLMVLESWMVKPNEEEAAYIQKHGEFKVPPSQHPNRIEIVLFSLTKANGDDWSCWAEIKRDATGKPSILALPPKLEYLRSKGRFANLFEEGGEVSHGAAPTINTTFR
jgi:hypothetical protein